MAPSHRHGDAASTPSTRHRVAATPPARRHAAATPLDATARVYGRVNVHRRSTQAEEDKKAAAKPTRVKRDRSANNLTIISDDGWETVPTTTASVRRSSSRKERSQSPANVPTDVNMGGFGALLGGDKKKKDKDKKKKKKSRSKDSLTDLEEVTSIPFTTKISIGASARRPLRSIFPSKLWTRWSLALARNWLDLGSRLDYHCWPRQL